MNRKTFLEAFGLFGIVVFAAACLWEAFAQPTPRVRLRDLSDVRIHTTPGTNDALIWTGVRWTNAPVASSGDTITNTVINSTTVNSTVINSTTINAHVAKGGSLTITNAAIFRWETLTLSGTNVSSLNLTNSLLFKLTLTTNGFLDMPINFPGTNFGASFQIHVKQDSTGGRSLWATNSAWEVGTDHSTNAMLAISTNANAVSVLTFVTSPFSASKLQAVLQGF